MAATTRRQSRRHSRRGIPPLEVGIATLAAAKMEEIIWLLTSSMSAWSISISLDPSMFRNRSPCSCIWLLEPDTLVQLYSTYWWRWAGGRRRASILPHPCPPHQQYPQKLRSSEWPSCSDPTDPVFLWTIRRSTRWNYLSLIWPVMVGLEDSKPFSQLLSRTFEITRDQAPATTPHLARRTLTGV